MKKILVGLGILVLLIVVAVVAIPFLVPTDVITRRVVAAVEARTGRDLAIEGPVELAFFPKLAVRLSEVRLSNPEGASRPDMVRLGELDVQVALLPLLGGEIAVDRFVLRRPEIALEIDPSGRPNWQFQETPAPSTAPAEEPGAQDQAGGGLGLTLGDVRIEDGEVSYLDQRSGLALSASDVDLALELGDLGGPMSAEGSGRFNDQTVNLSAAVDNAGVLLGSDTGATPVRVEVRSEPLTLAFEGSASDDDGLAAEGNLNLAVPSIAGLSRWLPDGLPADLPVDRVELAGSVDATPLRVAIGGMELSVDDIEVTGDLAASLDGPRPTVIGDLAVTRLDLDRLIAATPAQAPASAPGGAGTGTPADAGPTEIDLSPLRLADAQIGIELAGVRARGTEVGSTRVTVRLQDGKLDLSTSEAALFGGTAAVELSAAAADPQTFEVSASLDSIDLAQLPLVVDGVSGLGGSVTGDLTARTSGRDSDELVRNLDATGTAKIADAAVTYAMAGAQPIVVSGLNTAVEATPRRITLRDLAVTVDDVPATGQLGVELGGARPKATGDLRFGRLDLDRYIPAGNGAEAEPAPGDRPTAGDGGWSSDPIDLSALRTADADLRLAAEGIVVQGVETGPTALTVSLSNGALDARLDDTPVYGGTLGGALGVSGDAEPRITVRLRANNVQAEPLLTRFADFSRLVGTLNGSVDLTGTGASQRDLVRSLGGSGAVLFSDGAIKGINIAAMLRNVTGAFDAANRGEAQQTDFAELGGTFKVASGVLTTNDLRMLAPLFRIEGQGESNIADRTLNFRLVPRLVASLEGQGGQADLGGVAVPILVRGSYDNVSFTPDLGGAVRDIIRDPAVLNQQIEALGAQADRLKDGIGQNPEDSIRELMRGLGGGAAPEAEGQKQPAPAQDDPARRLLDGILGGGRGSGGGQQPAPDPAERLRNLFGN